jgi:hypothetical protein
MGAVPTLLLNEKQVRRLVEDLEIRYLGNASRNLHFALLTDMPDSAETPKEDDPLVELCGRLIVELNEKYAAANQGTFALFHRHRIYNPREGVWMGWERKRGKLLDFNRLINGKYDSFPVKVGDLSLLPNVRFVLTLDTDTELPRGTAHRLVGAMTHPLNHCHSGLRDSAAAGWHQRTERVPVAAGQHLLRSDRLRYLHARNLGCVSGPERRGHFYRQRHLRGRNPESRPRASLPAQCLTQP